MNIKNNRIVAQWLPKKAWYFGGTVLVDLFCSKEDIDLCLEYDIPNLSGHSTPNIVCKLL